YLAVSSLSRLGARKELMNQDYRSLQPYLLTTVAAYAVGMLSIGVAYILPTYLLLGLTAVYLRGISANPGLKVPRLSVPLLGRLVAVSTIALAGIYVYVRMFVNWS